MSEKEIASAYKLKWPHVYYFFDELPPECSEGEPFIADGEAYLVEHIYAVKYGAAHDTFDLVSIRNTCIKDIYHSWCAERGAIPNEKEGWFKSRKFLAHLEDKLPRTRDGRAVNFVVKARWCNREPPEDGLLMRACSLIPEAALESLGFFLTHLVG